MKYMRRMKSISPSFLSVCIVHAVCEDILIEDIGVRDRTNLSGNRKEDMKTPLSSFNAYN
jgi:hypothetical protein